MVSPKKQAVTPLYSETDVLPALFTEPSGFFWKGGIRKTTTANSRKLRGQAAGSFVTATFFKTSRICLFAAAYAAPYKVLKVVKFSSPRGPARHLLDHPALAWIAWNSDTAIVEQHWEETTFPHFVFCLEQKPCCPAPHKQLHGGLFTAAASARSIPTKQKFHSQEQPQRKVFPVAVSVLKMRGTKPESIFTKSLEHHLAMFQTARFRVCFPLVSSFTV